MSMPERSGYKVDGGWAAGTDNLNGTTVPQQLTVDSRTGTPLPTEYKASTFIEFITGFTSGTGDEFLAYIATGTNTPGGSSGGTGSENVYRYGFNGKENDKDISEGGQDYGMRIYDSRLGRFLSVDPLTQKYSWLTSYQFSSNNPIKFIDEDGLEAAELESVFRQNLVTIKVASYLINKVLEPQILALRSKVNGETNTDKKNQFLVFLRIAENAYKSLFEIKYKAIVSNQNLKKLVPHAETLTYLYGVAETTIEVSQQLMPILPRIIVGASAKRVFDQVDKDKKAINKLKADQNTESVQNSPLVVEHQGESVPIYRGGDDLNLKPGEFKVSTSTEAKYPVRGLSLTLDKDKAEGFGGAFRIVEIPEGLKMIHTPSKSDPSHYDIIPVDPKTTQPKYQELLNQIKIEKAKL